MIPSWRGWAPSFLQTLRPSGRGSGRPGSPREPLWGRPGAAPVLARPAGPGGVGALGFSLPAAPCAPQRPPWKIPWVAPWRVPLGSVLQGQVCQGSAGRSWVLGSHGGGVWGAPPRDTGLGWRDRAPLHMWSDHRGVRPWASPQACESGSWGCCSKFPQIEASEQ